MWNYSTNVTNIQTRRRAEPEHCKTKKNGICVPHRHRSACPYTQSDISVAFSCRKRRLIRPRRTGGLSSFRLVQVTVRKCWDASPVISYTPMDTPSNNCLLRLTSVWATSWENLFLPYAINKGADQPAHLRSLISTFVVRWVDSIIPPVSISEMPSLYLASVAAHAGLRLTWSKTPKTGFLVKTLSVIYVRSDLI